MGVADGNLGRRAKMTRVFQRFLDTCSRRSHRAHGFPPNVVVFLKNCCVLVFSQEVNRLSGCINLETTWELTAILKQRPQLRFSRLEHLLKRLWREE